MLFRVRENPHPEAGLYALVKIRALVIVAFCLNHVALRQVSPSKFVVNL